MPDLPASALIDEPEADVPPRVPATRPTARMIRNPCEKLQVAGPCHHDERDRNDNRRPEAQPGIPVQEHRSQADRVNAGGIHVEPMRRATPLVMPEIKPARVMHPGIRRSYNMQVKATTVDRRWYQARTS
jgi:hypothetical protein